MPEIFLKSLPTTYATYDNSWIKQGIGTRPIPFTLTPPSSSHRSRMIVQGAPVVPGLSTRHADC